MHEYPAVRLSVVAGFVHKRRLEGRKHMAVFTICPAAL